MTNLTSILGGAVPTWVTGTTYALYDDAWSPISGLIYRRIVAGAGTTDPSADATNWLMVGAGKIKSIQRGTITLDGATAQTSDTAALSPAVVTANSVISFLGHSMTENASTYDARVALTNSTTVTATRSGAAGDTIVSWQVVEYWA